MIQKQNPTGGGYFRELGKGMITGLWMAMMKWMKKSLYLVKGNRREVLASSQLPEGGFNIQSLGLIDF